MTIMYPRKHVTVQSTASIPLISLIVAFPSQRDEFRYGPAKRFRVQLDFSKDTPGIRSPTPSSDRLSQTGDIAVSMEASPAMVCVGSRGLRATWLETRLEHRRVSVNGDALQGARGRLEEENHQGGFNSSSGCSPVLSYRLLGTGNGRGQWTRLFSFADWTCMHLGFLRYV
ncbi:hypothetical protein BDV98DRAFT_351908 [Pterulicium gracile]|uniref:Uncharacterized protein n=1 Tax=Pterulicium gracile TaxID=1884261 RepID=A0A5C3QTL5_9AGAR|nr:hypothetical protein BDV98DRAFT_351908 [Pterula gracilis]